MTLKSHVEVFIKKAINDTQRLRGRQEHYSTQRQLRVVPILNVRITKTSHKKKKPLDFFSISGVLQICWQKRSITKSFLTRTWSRWRTVCWLCMKTHWDAELTRTIWLGLSQSTCCFLPWVTWHQSLPYIFIWKDAGNNLPKWRSRRDFPSARFLKHVFLFISKNLILPPKPCCHQFEPSVSQDLQHSTSSHFL